MTAVPAETSAPGEGILAKFQQVRARDIAGGDVPDWMVRWLYQDQRGGEKYAAGSPQDFGDYSGPHQLAEWFHWSGSAPKPSTVALEAVQPLAEISRANDLKIAKRNGLELPPAHAHEVALKNAQDWVFTQLRSDTSDTPSKPRRVLDFGAGFGRQANLFTALSGDLTYVAMDAIPYSYCLQNFYFGQFKKPLFEYVDQPDDFHIDDADGLYHVPTWRHDLLPGEFFDLVMCVQVLNEIDAELSAFMIEVFHRVLKPSGRLYIRDHQDRFNPAGASIDEALRQTGFELAYQPGLRDGTDIHGIPRIWRKAAR